MKFLGVLKLGPDHSNHSKISKVLEALQKSHIGAYKVKARQYTKDYCLQGLLEKSYQKFTFTCDTVSWCLVCAQGRDGNSVQGSLATQNK